MVTWRNSSKQPRELRRERPRVEDRLRRHHPRPDDLERGVPATASSSRGSRRPPWKPAVEQGRDGARRGRRPAEPRAQLREPRDQLPGHALVREEVAVARGLAQERLQRLRHRERRPVDERLARATAEAPPGPGRRRACRRLRQQGRQQREPCEQGRRAPPPAPGLRPDTVRVVQVEGDVAIGSDAGPAPGRGAEPHLHGDRRARRTEPEQRAQVALRQVAAPGADLADLLGGRRPRR